MSLIKFTHSREGHVLAWCDLCDNLVGELSMAELGELSGYGIVPLCFACDSVGAEVVPSVLTNCVAGKTTNQFVVMIGGQAFFVDYDAPSPRYYFTPIPLSVFGELVAGKGG